MPISYAALSGKPVHLKLPLSGETLEVDWYPLRLSAEVIESISTLGEFADADDTNVTAAEALASIGKLTAVSHLLCDLIERWDLVEYIEDDGTPGPAIPLTPARLAKLGLPLLWAILMGLMQESRMGETTVASMKARSLATSSITKRAGSRR